MTRIIIVDENDKEIGFKTYQELKYEDIYRVTALWLTDSDADECLITQRKWTKHNDPGKWMAAVSGTVEEDETFDSNIVKETEEEIGLNGLNIKMGPKSFVDEKLHKFFIQFYTADVRKDDVKIIIQEEEVEDYKWINKEELIQDVTDNPDKYVPSMSEAMKLLGYAA